ncbi:P-loop containing nucleoside triphosphate hydrolase protein [Daldinia decipiens]|uniref:P-loop containing nucleoside triphosphate hydrolase protein n=1 Tax=Daldinia decipiens TaxID=326647 RepID=UPI0020C4C998|nr:P-loop containing nucleoside triphosphate hydrolase protein [Daldinia decipiens]KAI1654584.1 P-loop containing nucleoside triphosphate hydrolase protein [Daldinia decipiens]
MATMVENGDVVDPENKKIHPFFVVPKNSFKDNLFSNVTPVTPDPSCSPKSVDDNTDSTPLSGKRKRKRKHRHTDDARDTSLDSSSKPPKVLKLNLTTGTIGSPPRSQPIVNKKNTKRGRKNKTFLASIRYGQGDDTSRVRIAQRITEILAGSQGTKLKITRDALPNTPPSSRDTNKQPSNGLDIQEESTQKKGATKCILREKTLQPATSKIDTTPNKPTHPFFQGKPKPSTAIEEKENSKLTTTSQVKRHVFFSSTPSSSKHLRPAPPKFNFPTPGMSYSNNVKVPGAQHPAWPSKEAAHVRGDIPQPYETCEDVSSKYLLKARKAKGQQVRISESESILNQVVSNLNLKQLAEELKAYDNNEFHPPPAVLRIPGRHFESGKNLQARIFGELKTLHPCGDDPKAHPAITHAYNSIEKGLSAFDRSTCETSSWAQKYAPSSAERVLQSGREAELLRDWLENLKVLAVDTGTIDSGTKPKAIASTKGKGKRKKKSDGFIVFSDEEADELSEISDASGDWSASGSHGNAKKTMMRSGSHRDSRDGGRFVNAVVLSGPHGCGKTATVYAIAKELDFEVFEINSGARRNGKDVLEKVGDMTRNHLVQHHHKNDSQREEVIPEDEVDRDLKSGKQGTMTAFFKPNPALVQKPAKSADLSSVKEVKKPSKTQKQSLILLEEVDVLYEEDKQFWNTVISMILQSKRPFVMTCNDEALVPLQSLNLHGIFRFSSPTKDLAVDLLLLIAANEGHALRRHAVETLYDSRGHDLRASITELNYWCQIGVGDAQGGFNWFYPRWPKGSDVDEGGDTIRVVSQDTYQAGMGWLNRDSAVSNSLLRSAQEELHQQAFCNWSFDVYESCPYDDFVSRATIAIEQGSSAKERLELFKSIESFTGFMSDADIGSSDFSDVPNQVSMDASIPHIPTKMREDFIVGRQLLEAFPLVRYDPMGLDVSTALKDLGKNKLRDVQTFDGNRDVCRPLGEAQVTTKLEVYLSDLLHTEPAIVRLDYSLAFDPIAASEKNMAAGYLEPSVFDGTTKTISLDIAPYVRGIVAYDQRLQQERLSRSSLLSEGGQPGRKRMRTTRSAYSAIEGGARASTRRERYFTADINPHLVMRTGGRGWNAIASFATRSQDAAGRSVQNSGEFENDDNSD